MKTLTLQRKKSMQQLRGQLLFDLIYGKDFTYYNIEFREEREVILYLFESNAQILIAVDRVNSQVRMFEIKRLTINTSNYKYEQLYQLKRQRYLIVEDSEDSIILIFQNSALRNQFHEAAKVLRDQMLKNKSEVDSDIIKCFIKSDTNKNFVIELQELDKMFDRLKLFDVSQRNELYQMAKEQNKFQSLTFHDFQRLAKICMCRKELLQIFCSFSNREMKNYKYYLQQIMKIEDFQQFLTELQGETKEKAKIIASSFNQNEGLSFYDFSMFILSQDNDIESQQYRNFRITQKQPLTNYYCHSSHNTYLTGDQLNSDSRTQRYYQDLRAGIRCVEIDCHEGTYEPIVKHGNTLTSAVYFEDVLKQIEFFCQEQNYNHTPIILSIENHCGNEYQQKMVNSFKAVFQRPHQILIIPKQMGQTQFKCSRESFSLEELTGKIIIKGSGNLNIYFGSLVSEEKNKTWAVIRDAQQSDSQQEIKDQSLKEQKIVKKRTIPKQRQSQYDNVFLMKRDAFQNEINNKIRPDKKKFFQIKKQCHAFAKKFEQSKISYKTKTVINKNLLYITSMLGSGSLGNPSFWESVSLSQDKIIGYYQQDKQKILGHTKGGWIRSYPKNLRFDSSNFNPFPSLELGVQIIALNTQMVDYPTLIMKKFFERSSKKIIGYRPKPEYIYERRNMKRPIKKITITPISASKIYFNSMAKKRQTPVCQVRMRLYCFSSDLSMNIEATKWKQYTQPVTNNAFNPIFSYTKRQAMKITYAYEQFGFVVVEIRDAGIGVIPLESIKTGYRVLSLYDNEGKLKVSKIILLIQKSN